MLPWLPPVVATEAVSVACCLDDDPFDLTDDESSSALSFSSLSFDKAGARLLSGTLGRACWGGLRIGKGCWSCALIIRR